MAMDAPPVHAEGLVKRYGHIVAVDHVDLTVQTGDVYGYLGPNGAGKTTSLRMLLGLIRPTEGSAKLFGRDPLHDGARALEGVAGFVEEPRFYPYLTGRKNLELLAAFDGGEASSRVDDALETVELADRAKDRVGGYSHGMRQRLGIAAALLRDPRLLLLDEPPTGLAPPGRRYMRTLIGQLSEGPGRWSARRAAAGGDPAAGPPRCRAAGACRGSSRRPCPWRGRRAPPSPARHRRGSTPRRRRRPRAARGSCDRSGRGRSAAPRRSPPRPRARGRRRGEDRAQTASRCPRSGG